MKRFRTILIVIITSASVLLAQQGSTMLKDRASNRLAAVSGFNALYVTPIDGASGAAFEPVTDDCDGAVKSVKRYISVGSSDDESQVTASAGTFCGISARNANTTTDAFIKCTDATAANTTPGSTAIFYEMIVPAGSGFVDRGADEPFSTALTCYIVTGKADNDATDVAASDVSYNLTYVN